MVGEGNNKFSSGKGVVGETAKRDGSMGWWHKQEQIVAGCALVLRRNARKKGAGNVLLGKGVTKVRRQAISRGWLRLGNGRGGMPAR